MRQPIELLPLSERRRDAWIALALILGSIPAMIILVFIFGYPYAVFFEGHPLRQRLFLSIFQISFWALLIGVTAVLWLRCMYRLVRPTPIIASAGSRSPAQRLLIQRRRKVKDISLAIFLPSAYLSFFYLIHGSHSLSLFLLPLVQILTSSMIDRWTQRCPDCKCSLHGALCPLCGTEFPEQP